MTPDSLYQSMDIASLFETLLPDFVLAFAFFTALSYAMLSKRLGQQRPAAIASASIGLAMALGLVWWEQRIGLSVKNLGSLAAGFAILLVALVMHQVIRHIGGRWAGAGISVGAALMIAQMLQISWPIRGDILQGTMIVALVVGILAFLMHHGRGLRNFSNPSMDPAPVRHDMRDLDRAVGVSHALKRNLHRTIQEADGLHDHPDQAGDILFQIKRMLLAEGYLTQRMVLLKAHAHRMREGQIAEIEETRDSEGPQSRPTVGSPRRATRAWNRGSSRSFRKKKCSGAQSIDTECSS